MTPTIKQLKRIQEALIANIDVDWEANDPSDEFSILADMLGPCITDLENLENPK